MKKICNNCGVPKDLELFHKNPTKKDGLCDKCKDCRRIYHREHYLKNKETYLDNVDTRKKGLKEWFTEYKSTLSCIKCGENRHWVLDFHHEGDKAGDVSHIVASGSSKKKILMEISKCIVLCSNCHRDLHYQEMQNKQ